LNKINEHIISKIKNSKKYVGCDENNNIYISLQMAEDIHKDFNFLSINNSNANHVYKKTTSRPQMSFKPTTNPNSDLLSNNFRRKIQIDISESNMDLTDKIKSNHTAKNQQNKNSIELEYTQENKFNINYINSLLIKKKKREKIMAKKKEETESKELVECSFRPKINSDYPLEQSRIDRFEALHKVGTKLIQNKKEKTKEEYEIEKNGKECTHVPLVSKEIADYSEGANAFDGASYNMYFERIKKGRYEQKLKDIIHSREPLQTLEEIEKNENETKKLGKRREMSNEKKIAARERSKSQDKSTNRSSQKEGKKAENENMNMNMNLRAFNKKETEEKKEEKKEVIPLLIIDVNLRPGEKKKIYVFDGDTAEGLAEKFSKEHNLDIETRNKLKVLIQSHMSKLLMRIDEENQSINSEKSSSNIFQ